MSSGTGEALADRVRRRLVAADSLTDAVLAESTGIVDDVVFSRLRQQVEAELVGAGPLEALLALDDVTDVLVNSPDSVWLDRGRGLERTSVYFPAEADVRRLACRLAAGIGRRLDDAMPWVDGVLPDGTRLHAVLPPLAEHTTVSLRVLGRRTWDLNALVGAGCMPAEVADRLREMVRRRLPFVITGGTGSGKTTLLGALLGEVAADERLLLVEDTAELSVRHPHVVRLVPRPANIEGAGEIGVRELVRQALRMRPDRIVVGEFRGAEFVELLVALNTGHRGGAATMHANSARDVPARFLALGALAGVSPSAVTSLAGPAAAVIVHVERGPGGRRLEEIGLLATDDDRLVCRPVWRRRGGWGRAAGRLEELMAAAGR